MSSAGTDSAGVVQFAHTVLLTKLEAFEVCELCADAERALAGAGLAADAAKMAEIFELIEGRLVCP